jgi:flagellar biosynthesis protein FliR
MISDLGYVCAVSARIFGVLVCLPFGDALQSLPRLFLAVCFGVALSSHIELSATPAWHTPLTEFLVGLLLATPIRMFAEAAEMLGELLDTARGQTIGSVVDPLNGQQVSDMASLLRIGATVLVIQVGGFERMLEAVRSSYSYLPLVPPVIPEDFLHSIVTSGLRVVIDGCSLSSVWLLVYLLSDIAAALLSKMMHGVSFVSTASLVKLVMTLVLLVNLLMHPSQVSKIAVRASAGVPQVVSAASLNLRPQGVPP